MLPKTNPGNKTKKKKKNYLYQKNWDEYIPEMRRNLIKIQ